MGARCGLGLYQSSAGAGEILGSLLTVIGILDQRSVFIFPDLLRPLLRSVSTAGLNRPQSICGCCRRTELSPVRQSQLLHARRFRTIYSDQNLTGAPSHESVVDSPARRCKPPRSSTPSRPP